MRATGGLPPRYDKDPLVRPFMLTGGRTHTVHPGLRVESPLLADGHLQITDQPDILSIALIERIRDRVRAL